MRNSAIIVVCAVLLGYATAFMAQCETAELYKKRARQAELREEALRDSLRLAYVYEDREVYVRQAMPDMDSLRGAIAGEMRSLFDRERKAMIAALQFEILRPVVESSGSEVGEGADTLLFSINDTLDVYSVHMDLSVHPPSKRLAYDLTIMPDPERFKVYATEDAGKIEFWLETGSGRPSYLSGYVKPFIVPEDKISARWDVEGSLVAGRSFGLLHGSLGRSWGDTRLGVGAAAFVYGGEAVFGPAITARVGVGL